MRILVTGGAGFIGSHLTRALLAAGHHVCVVDDLSGGFERNLPPKQDGFEFHQESIVEGGKLNYLFATRKFEAIYHLAAYAAEGLSHFIRRFNYTNNVIGSVNLINSAIKHGVKRFVFTSSIAVYGHGERPFREDQHPAPADPYGIAKLAVEQDLFAAREMFGLEHTIFRPHNVFGEYQHIGDRYRNVVGIFMNQLLRGEPLSVFGDGEQTRAFSYVGDIIGPMVRCLSMPETSGETFNIGGDTPTTVLDLARTIMDVAGKPAEIKHLEARHEVVHAYSDHSKVCMFFGGSASTALYAGLEKMWAWAKALGPQEPSRFSGIEVHRNLPPSWKEG